MKVRVDTSHSYSVSYIANVYIGSFYALKCIFALVSYGNVLTK